MKKKRARTSDTSGTRLGPADWLRAAREELIENGILAVKVDRLARRLGVTRGGFYWHFTGPPDLLDQLLESWATTNTEPFKRALALPLDAQAKFQAIVDLWLAEEEYDPTFDSAVREWARVSPEVARVVHRVDDERIAVFRSIFLELGYQRTDAFVRARITYFHQVGYYSLGIVESRSVRERLRPHYARALLGMPATVKAR